MNKSALAFLLLLLTATPHAGAQPGQRAPEGRQVLRPHDYPPEQREQWREERREERRQRRETLQQMSPEERHQLRRDVREAGERIYLQRHPRRPD